MHFVQVGVSVLLIVAATLSKMIGICLPAYKLKLPTRISLMLGVLMSCKGLIALIVVNYGMSYKIITPKLFAILILMVLVTTMQTVPLLLLVDPPSRAAVSAAELREWEDSMREAASHSAAHQSARGPAVSGPWARFKHFLDNAARFAGLATKSSCTTSKPTPEDSSVLADELSLRTIEHGHSDVADVLPVSASVSGNCTPRCEVSRQDSLSTGTEWARVLEQRRERTADWALHSAPQSPCEQLSWSDIKTERYWGRRHVSHVEEGSLW
jgi:hypothetical protein